MQANPFAGLSMKTRKWTPLIEKQRVEFDAQKRKELLYKVQEIAVDEAYWLYLYEGQYIAAMRENVHGVSFDPLGFHHLQDMWMS